MRPPGLFLNEDADHFAYTRAAEAMSPAGVDQLVDYYARDTGVSDLVFNVNANRSSVASNVKQPFWDGFDPAKDDDQEYFKGVPDGRPAVRHWVHNMLRLHERGIDPYERWLARSRFYGCRAWISVRMNDIHAVDQPDSMMHDRLWREHPEYWRVPYREFEWPGDRSIDYGHAAVREHFLAYTKEMVERYDMDGLELDWMRQPWLFRPGFEEKGIELLNDFMAEVQAILHSRAKVLGHRIELLVRVPSKPDVARRMGFDVSEWARRGWVDVVCPGPGFGNTDFDIPLEIWRQLLHGTAARVTPGLEISVTSFPFGPVRYHTLRTARGAAISLLDRGADQIYLFNFMDSDPGTNVFDLYDEPTPTAEEQRPPAFATMLRELGAMAHMAGKPRRHVVTFPTVWTPGEVLALPFPQRLGRFGYRPTTEFRIPIGPAPLREEPASVQIGLETTDPVALGRTVMAHGRLITFGLPSADRAIAQRVAVRVNGVLCEFSDALPERIDSYGPTHRFRVAAGALHRGDNMVEITNPTDMMLSLTWVEIGVG